MVVRVAVRSRPAVLKRSSTFGIQTIIVVLAWRFLLPLAAVAPLARVEGPFTELSLSARLLEVFLLVTVDYASLPLVAYLPICVVCLLI